MQNYEAILSELEIEIPEGKKADLKKKMEENYRTKSDYDKVVTKRDEYKNSLDNVQKELEGFKDVNVEELQTKVTTLTTQLNEEKAGRAADARKAEVEKQVNDFLTATDEKGAKKYEFLNDITATEKKEQRIHQWVYGRIRAFESNNPSIDIVTRRVD